jgi:HTH-type transcriptional regulator / antitoxin HigA
MTTTTAPFLPDWASPPGDTLVDLLDERSMTQTELAERLGVSLKHVNRVIKGAASVSAEFALGLEKVFGAPASFWMTREAHFQADRARLAQRDEFANAVDWARQFPISELRKRGVLPSEGDGADLVEQLLGFLGIAHPAQWKEPLAAYRRSQKFESDPYALSSWLRQGELEAIDIDCAPYDETRLLDVLQEARALTCLTPKEWWPRLQELGASVGVAIVIVDVYQGARANGATRWLAADKALVQLSLRYRWEDIFWFSFFHEMAHVILHRKKDVFVEVAPKDRSADPESRQLEEEANRFAARALIPTRYESRLKALTLSDAPEFARALGIAPAIVVGRLQHDGRLRPYQGNGMRRRLVFTS